MSKYVTQEPVVLEGYQAIMKPSKFGYTLSALIDVKFIEKLEKEREDLLKWEESKLKNPRRSVLKPEPWEHISGDIYKVKFTWNDKSKPHVVDSEGTLIVDENIPIYSGSRVKIAFRQKSYTLKDSITYGTNLKLTGIQVVALNGAAGVDAGDLDETEVAALFGQCKGFKVGEPNVTPASIVENDDDF